jgi:hypothetical protein
MNYNFGERKKNNYLYQCYTLRNKKLIKHRMIARKNIYKSSRRKKINESIYIEKKINKEKC